MDNLETLTTLTYKTQADDKQIKTQHRKLKRWATQTSSNTGVNPGASEE